MEPRTWGNYWDYFGKRLIEYLEIPVGSKVLDLGSGGGSTLFPAAEATGKSGHVLGIEMWDSMVEGVNRERARCGITNASVEKMDAREMQFSDGSFDVVIAGFIGFDNYFDFVKCEPIKENTFIEQMIRVLKPGGKAAFSTWTMQEDTDYIYGVLSSAWQDMEKPFSKENEKGWRVILSSFGLEDVRIIHDSLAYAFPSLKAWWDEVSNYGWREPIETAAENTGSTQEEITLQIFDNLGNHLKEDGSVVFRRNALYAIGRKHS
jgi:ubiquinone/menaquinone biosynthesis C-methylase UbiE